MSAAASLATHARHAGHEVETIDCMDFSPEAFAGWFRGGYEFLVRHQPWLWGHLYRTSDRPLFNYTVQTAMDYSFLSQLEPLIKRFQPHWVICTHSVPQPRLAALRSEYGYKVAVVVTDLYPHRMWLRGNPDLYCLPTDWSMTALRKRVGKAPRAEVTGIPIGAQFGACEFHPPSSTRKVKILLSAGGIGGGPLVAAAKALATLPIEADVDVLCGGNSSAFADIDALPTGGKVCLKPLGLLPNDQVAEKMKSAHVFVGKPGGLTTFESMACGLPFVVLDPCLIPGQEERNAEFLTEVGAGVRARTIKQLPKVVSDLLKDPRRLELMREQGLANARPDAAAKVLNLLESVPVVASSGRLK